MSNNHSQPNSSSTTAKQGHAAQVAQAAQVAKNVAQNTVSAVSHAKTYTNMSTNRFIAVCIWLVGAYLTSNTLHQLGVGDTYNIVLGGLIQLALTRAEAPIWSGRGIPKMGIAALLVDVGINSAGAWPFTKNIGQTDFWTMMRDVMENPNLQAQVGTQLALAILVGAFTAAAVEYFWHEN